MRTQRSTSNLRRRRSRDRGSALLVTLVVVAGLSLLGLAFVGVSETESAISVNQRNALQTQAIAEAGARSVVEWFQDPTWARQQGIMPSNNPAPVGMKVTRVVGGYSGVYKPLATTLLFDKPYRPAPQNRFFGTEENPDIIITHEIDNQTMVNLNTYLFGSDNRMNGRISEIVIYAPPIVGGTVTNGFWTTGERFGTATIRVTAEKWSRANVGDAGDNLLARKTVRIVVGEFPMPIPAGPLQTAANAQFGGNFRVHWGDEIALGNLNPGVTATRIPWANPFERPSFERGYDNEVWPLVAPTDRNYLQEFVGKEFGDPWAGSRARGTNSQCAPACGAYTWSSVEGQPVHAAFQDQTVTEYPVRRAVTFPSIRYDIWKRIAVQGRGTKGIFYFEYVNGTNPPTFRRNGQGAAHGPHYWVNTIGGANLGAGFYFFDSKGGANPQRIDGSTDTARLTPGFSWQSAEFGSAFHMSGFIYFNVAEYRSTGGGNKAPTRKYNMPGEIYRDVGYRVWDTGTNDWEVDAAGGFVLQGAGDGEWSFQDLNGNGKFDVVVTGPQTFTSNDPAAVNHAGQYAPRTWSSAGGCTVPPAVGAAPASACSEPHEPYLNFIYPTARDGVVTVGWEADGAQTRRPRDLIGVAGVPNCATEPDRCTSNGYDRDGALVDIPALLNGVMYNEGEYQSQGNIHYFGSILIRGDADAQGTADVWFDEKLIKDDWSPPGMPRVLIFSEMTDEQDSAD